MENKEKQIEEMKDIVHNLWDKLNQDAITTNDIVNALYNAGYRKLPEDSVVLSREELSKRDYEFRQIGYDECLRDNPKKDKYIKTLESENERLNKSDTSKENAMNEYYNLYKDFKRENQQLKAENESLKESYIVKAYDKLRAENKKLKETFKKFTGEVKENLKESVNAENVDYYVECVKVIDKILKRYSNE